MPLAVHPLLVGFVDPRTPSRPLYNEELKQALRNVISVLRSAVRGDARLEMGHAALPSHAQPLLRTYII
jgi:hypothetical protein